jgi:hypothetical protein
MDMTYCWQIKVGLRTFTIYTVGFDLAVARKRAERLVNAYFSDSINHCALANSAELKQDWLSAIAQVNLPDNFSVPVYIRNTDGVMSVHTDRKGA